MGFPRIRRDSYAIPAQPPYETLVNPRWFSRPFLNNRYRVSCTRVEPNYLTIDTKWGFS